MSQNLFNRYVWLVDTIRRHGRITRSELNRLWGRSRFGDGTERGIPRRTFYNYRAAIEELFGVTINYDSSTYEYSIEPEDEGGMSPSMTDWMLNAAAMGTVVQDAQEAASRIFVEDVPSARIHLSTVISALKGFHTLTFTYTPYTRVNPTLGVVLEPYFLKIFRQRWYITGRNVKDGAIKTYALDRMSDVILSTDTFELPGDFDAGEYVNDAFGIIFTQGQAYDVMLRVDSRRAKYLRTLPLHHSQRESVADGYSIFHFHLRLTGDFVNELLSFGPSVTVLSPPELKAMMISSLQESLSNYGTD
ncbi:MAG: WYL domain-containing protein [Bacteroides sp.]|nr:WYL domain-containing protein [Bacteroides sp.]